MDPLIRWTLKKDKLFLEGDVKCEKDSIWERVSFTDFEYVGSLWKRVVTLTVHVHLSSAVTRAAIQPIIGMNLEADSSPYFPERESSANTLIFQLHEPLSRDLSHVITELLAYRTTS